jgi:hypothetical protein
MLGNQETQMKVESEEIFMLFESLRQQPKRHFPKIEEPFDVPIVHGVYVIYQGEDVLHVGRTIRAEKGLRQRLLNHPQGKSSFARAYLREKGINLRDEGVTFQFLKEPDHRKRALLEAFAIGKLCPRHIGVGINK